MDGTGARRAVIDWGMAELVNVLLVGGGGREHALAWKLAQSPRLGQLWLTHAENPGLAALGRAVDVPVGIREIYRLQQFCEHKQIGLVVIGPEEPLAEGFADKLAAPGRVIFGPTQAAAQLESDKAFCKDVLRSASIPTAEGRAFRDPEQARAFIEARLADRRAVDGALNRASMVRGFEERVKALIAEMNDAAGRLSGEDRVGAVLALMHAAADNYRDPADRRKLMDELRRTTRGVSAVYDTPLADLPVIKAAGLAKGKGVILPATLGDAVKAIDDMMVRRVFGEAGRQVVVEERLEGREVSVLAVVDGRNILVLPPCQDHKRLRDGDEGPNTGGMGAFCPSGTIDAEMMGKIEREILVPTVDALRRDGVEYKGVLYAGLMLTPGGPKVLEYNCRFGDPECQPLVMRLKSDLIELMLATAEGRLDQIEVDWDERPACCVVVASGGYPERPVVGKPIQGLQEAAALRDVMVFQAGTKAVDGQVVSAGGRVLGVTALGETMHAARERAYAACGKIKFDGMQYRRDIAAGAGA